MTDTLECFFQQARYLAFFYLFLVMCDLTLLSAGDLLNLQESYICIDNAYIVVIGDSSGIFLLFYSLIVILFGILIWFVIYKIPE